MFNKEMLKLFLYWIKERHTIYTLKNNWLPKPWTEDPILQQFRFCNVYRERDTVTQWIHRKWLHGKGSADEHVWFAMVVARLVNWPQTLDMLGYPAPWNPGKFVRTLHKRKALGAKVFSGAYIVSTNGVQMDKAEYLADRVLTPLWKARNKLKPTEDDTLQSFYDRLRAFQGMGSFIAAQVVADVKHTKPLKNAEDFESFAASGPGSRRGMNRILGRAVNASWVEHEWKACLDDLVQEVNCSSIAQDLPMDLDAQNIQNCLCEFDKYVRVKNGEGTPRSRYDGA